MWIIISKTNANEYRKKRKFNLKSMRIDTIVWEPVVKYLNNHVKDPINNVTKVKWCAETL